ncbi:Pseudouridine synthase [Rhodotorula toruloides ATCC 204091]|uniref:Pseudouridine synthase n=1 Tax=Rhodotorula toruloides TaxID=5286 RepID=A0A2T0ABM9_RHOTO|nr:Pseudouridine synthase [Rhodotorula toruloides ATCC 204091]KAK4334583.1 tRNA pseudouridine(38/39) synthase [Rhodotorula toruloides]PRQ75414.1 pseudouridine synthase [Rhodotorula toruloides]
MPLPHNPERALLVQQIQNLQHRLAKLDNEDPPSSPSETPTPAPGLASTSKANSPKPPVPLTGKRARKAQAATGPLPPSLANAPKRHIALLFSYEGWAHSGLAYQPKGVYTPLPTVEGCILDALEKARLIEPITESEGFGCGFERCGRTDAGVSSSAQVINLWVRSDLEDPMKLNGREIDPDSPEGRRFARSGSPSRPRSSSSASSSSSDSVYGSGKRKAPSDVEIPYVTLLNKHLPPSIRMHAWSPISATFSSRYSCIWRHYKYFFSTSPISPLLASRFDFGAAYEAAGALPEHAAEWQERLRRVDWNGLQLDVDLMRDAVKRLVGEHDFRNLCKIDPPKQLKLHIRTVNSASIDPLEGEGGDMFVLNLRGGAFLYNQVRHIVAILFLVGARLEHPSLVDKLLWTSDRTSHTVSQNAPPAGQPDHDILDQKPSYQMAEDLPLILWQCGFNSTEFDWRTDNAPRPGDVNESTTSYLDHNGREKQPVDQADNFRKLFLEMNETYTEYRLKAIVLKHHLASFAFHAPPIAPPSRPASPTPESSCDAPPSRLRPASPPRRPLSVRAEQTLFTPVGAGKVARTTSYTPVLERKRGETPDVINARWAQGRGAQKMQRRKDNQEAADKTREVHLKIKAEAMELAKRLEEERLQALRLVDSVSSEPVSGVATPDKGES